MKIPDVTPEALQQAMDRFDEELRNTPAWAKWQEDEVYKYAVERNGQLYPVKKIVSLATGSPVTQFSGGDQANGYVESRGLKVIDIPSSVRGIKSNLDLILQNYVAVTQRERYSGASSLSPMFRALRRSLETSEALKKHPSIMVEWTVGAGNWAAIPWVAFLDKSETDTTQKGVYCVFLFREDMSGVYLTLNQGVQDLNDKLGRKEARKVYHSNAQSIRQLIPEIAASGFHLDDGIDLRASTDLGKDYEKSTIAYKFYEAGSVPADDLIQQDIDAALSAYGRYLSRPSSGAVAPAPDPLSELADALLIDRYYLATIKSLLERKNQVIFYGPPGTGKTYIARELAKFLVGIEDRLEIVQFHPSYAYEDFVEGYRPTGASGFHLVDGPLKRIAKKASENNETHVLIIDEVNRGNVTKVFGELYYLLEYRDEEIALVYSREPFKLPRNLWIIATMNTADRSIALMDAALRRRFYFVDFFPDTPPIQGLLQRWLRINKPDFFWLAGVVDLANRNLGDRHVAIGPSYFMDKNLSEDWIRIIWKYSIMPYLEEHFFGQEERLKDFELESLRQSATTT